MATKSAMLQKILDTLDGLSSTATLDIAKIWAMLGYAYKELKAVSFSGDANLYFAVDAGSTDAYAISVTGYTAYVNGDTFIFVANTDNTEAASLNVTTIGAKALKKSVNQDLETGDILAGQIIICAYDATNDYFQLLGGSSGSFIQKSIVTAKGDIIAATASGAIDNLPVGNNGQILIPDSSKTTGLAWVDYYTGLERQACMNSNFEVAQRGTSLNVVDVTSNSNQILIDRWRIYIDKNGGTLPALTLTQHALTPGELNKSSYCCRLTTDGAGSGLGNNSYGQIQQRIEHGARKLCGDGRKITISFYARSSISNKRLGVNVGQNYGTGGSPSSEDWTTGTNFTLTSSWQKFTYTFTTNTLTGKVFGTNNDDYLRFNFSYIWGSDLASFISGASTAETFGGSGTIDIAQVQINSGEVALPYMPKSFAEELRDCIRYYEKSYEYITAPGTAMGAHGAEDLGYWSSTSYVTAIAHKVKFTCRKRIAPVVSVYDGAGHIGKITKDGNTDNINYTTLDSVTENGFRVWTSEIKESQFHWTADAEF